MFLKKIIFSLFLLLMLCPFQASTVVIGASTKELFDSGVEAFGNENFEKALFYFKAAQEGGLDSEALHYNLGVNYFKLGQYKKAKEEFQWLLNSSDAGPLAHYNLGLIALRIQNQSEAQTHFQSAYRLSEDSKLKKIAEIQLEQFDVKPEPPAWSGYISFGAGHDDNVTLDIDGSVDSSEIKDEFLDMIASGTWQLAGTRKNGLQLKAGGYQLKYKDIDEYDFASLSISPEIDYKLGSWQTDLSGNAGLLYLGGTLFERMVGAGIGSSRSISPGLELDIRYRFDRLSADDTYDYLSGTRHQLSVGVRSILLDTYSSLKYFLELNNRNDDTNPTRHGLRLNVNRDINAHWDAEMTFGYRFSEYHDISRKDKRLRLGLKVSRKIPWEWKLYGKYVYTQNDSNDNQSEYISNIVSMGVERFF